MVLTCIVPGCGNKPRVYSPVVFHTIPIHYKRRRVWLAALELDISTPLDVVRTWRVCSEHFTDEDYTETGKRLKDTATPSIQKLRILYREAPVNIEIHDLPGPEDFPEALPHSTPEKQKPEETTAKIRAPMPVHLGSPSQTRHPKRAVLAPTWTMQSNTASSSSTMATTHSPRKSLIYDDPHLIGATAMDMSATSDFDVSMTSETALDPADSSYAPDTSPSTSATGSSSSLPEQLRGWRGRKWIVDEANLMELFQRCPECHSAMCDVHQSISCCGSRIRVKWQCDRGHVGKWESCPEVRGMPENNLLAQAAILFTGATYTDIADWAGLLNLQLPHKTWYNEVQRTYLIPVIEQAYRTQEDIIKARLICQSQDGEGVQLCGDGRSDSPGHSSKYNTYSFMDDATKQIVGFELMQVSQASSSAAMEPLGFRKGLDNILDEGINVTVVTTDRHPSIRKIMREDYPELIHQFDPWHVVKGFRKKMVATSNRREYKDLGPWVRSIANHMWWSCCTCKGDPKELLRRWLSLLCHITGVHRWEENNMEYTCFHKELPADQQRSKRWLMVTSPSYKALKSMMMDTRFLKDLQQMTLFKHTGQLEVFHNSLLKYCPKRLHFEYPAMKARTMLAVMDHNENHETEREQARAAGGLPKTNVVHKRQSGRWISRPIYVETTQKFREDLMERVLERRRDPSVRPKDKAFHMPIPQLAANIARVPKPSKEDARKSHTSRFQGPPQKED